MQTFETTTQIAPIIDVGTYDSLLSYDSIFDEQVELEHKEGKFVCEDFDFEKYKQTIVKEANKIFSDCDLLSNYGVKSIVATNMGSPQYYNYITDWLELKVEVEDDFLDRAEAVLFAPQNEQKIDEFMETNWATRDGFLSSMPAERIWQLPEVFKMLREDNCGLDDMRAFGSILMLLVVVDNQQIDIGFDEPVPIRSYLTDRLVQSMQDVCNIKDYCTVLNVEEVRAKYGDLLFIDALDAAKTRLETDLEKYKLSGASDETIKLVEAEVSGRIDKIDDYRNQIYNIIEWNWTGADVASEKIAKELKDLKEKWEFEFGEDPTRRQLGAVLPGQLELPIEEKRR